ncbi:hypothetical protein AX16_004849 [Volvariella volvacea WC 439]|nr:hypothetical protein AX16_004849 [Volvariella volvacea WC 439]
MSAESSRRSNLIDVTFFQLHSILCGRLEGVTLDQLTDYLKPRKSQLGNIKNPFGKPSDASKKLIESGSVKLADGVVIRVEEEEREFIFAISKKFEIDQIQALILLRSFLYNEGLPSAADTTSSMVEELLEAITPFYHSEILSIHRTLIPLFRANENAEDPIYEVASEFLPTLIRDGEKFAEDLLTEYLNKTKTSVPQAISGDPKAASRWVKQNLREELVLLEVLFWVMWGFAPCSSLLVEQIFNALYNTNLGSIQASTPLVLDEESIQLQQDCNALWILISIEVLELETLGNEVIEISDTPTQQDVYTSSPDALKRLHELVTSHTGSQFACTYLAWTYVLARVTRAVSHKEIPSSYRGFFESIQPKNDRAFSKDPVYGLMAKACLEPDVGFFNLLSSLLTRSPLFVTAVAWKTGSAVTDPNAIAFRSVLKGLLIALVELVAIELMPDYDGLINVWEALFGRSEPQSIAGICAQYWQFDWQHNASRRAIFDVARSRFPTHSRPLIRLLRAMSASGFLDTDPLSVSDHGQEGEPLMDERDICARHVYYYLHQLPSYTQIIPAAACTGAHALYERQPERFTSGKLSGLIYINLRPIRLPGGSILPARSQGRLLSGDGGDYIIVCWQHEHSGWKLLLEILTDYVNRKRSGGVYQDVSFGRREASQIKTLRLEEIGIEIGPDEEDAVITDILDLVRSLIQDNPSQAQQLMESLEEGDPVVSHTMLETQAPDLVQVTTMILEEALTRSGPSARTMPQTALITSAMSVLSALLVLPEYSSRVWLYVRSTTALFGSERATGFASVALAAERATGHYTMTLALLHLVQQLFKEASSLILPDNPRLLQVKEEVLMRAARFVHTEIWVEHLGWRYAQLGDRFEIGRRVVSFYVAVLEHASPILPERPFPSLSQAVADALLFKATTSTITPLVSSVNSGSYLLRSLYASRRHGDARRLIFLLESHLRLMRLILTIKQQSSAASKPSLLEQALCARVTGGATPHDSSRAKLDPIDVLATYVKERDVGNIVPVEAMHVLYALCSSLSTSQPSPPTIIGHLVNPEQTVSLLVRIVQHPYDDLALRIAVWNFISLAVDREPALATLFVTGQFRTPTNPKPWDRKGKGREIEPSNPSTEKPKPISATDVARDILTQWKSLWESNPQLLACVFRFLDSVWQHALEHKAVVLNIGQDEEFWNQVVGVASEEIGPVPEYDTDAYTTTDGIRRSNLHEAIAMHCYRITAKAHAIHILGLDIGAFLQTQGEDTLNKPTSFGKFERRFLSEDELMELIAEAAPNSYDPTLYDEVTEELKENCKGLSLEQVKSQVLPEEREFGDDFAFSTTLLRSRLRAYQQSGDGMEDRTDAVEKLIMSVNLNLSLTHAQMTLAESWQTLLKQVRPYLQGKPNIRSNLLSIASSISYDIAGERRQGDMMATIHGTRLSLLLAIVELAWFSNSDSVGEIRSFIELVKNVQGILQNESQPPEKSFIGSLSTPFHRTLLQIVYFCARQARNLLRKPKALNADHRLTVTSMVEATLGIVVEALRVNLLTARSRVDVELDRDMELLVAAFEQCTRKDINPSPSLWLARCQETDIIKTSLELYGHTDLVGLTDLPLLLARKQPLYAPYLLLFHMALVRHPAAAERLASQGILTAYSNNYISAAISAGMIEVVLPELPNERSPAHRAYCSMISIIASVITALGRNTYYFESDASAFIQLYGDQISRALSWTIGDPITFPLMEEMEQVVNLFYSLAESAPASIKQPDSVVAKVLRTFSGHALHLLQQISYAVTHPNHLASLLEPVTGEERVQLEKESAIGDPLKRPLMAQLVHRFYRLSSNVIGALVVISRAETVLTGAQEDWPVHEALVVPHSKVVPSEPASIGTLLELGNATLDVLRELVGRPAGQSLMITLSAPATSSVSSDLTLDVRQGVLTARRNLEGLLLYAVTQLAMWLSKPEFDGSGADMDADEPAGTMDVALVSSSRIGGLGSSTNERDRDRGGDKNNRSVHGHGHGHGHGRAPTMTLADRLRRGMTGEMAADLQSLLNKAKAVFGSSENVIGKGVVDVTPILLVFLQERIMSAS